MGCLAVRENAMRSIRLVALSLLGFAVVASGFAAPPTVRIHRPDFKLAISAKKNTHNYWWDAGTPINVKVRNVSLHTVAAGRWLGHPGVCYTIDVRQNGHPAPMTELYREIIAPKQDDPNVLETWSPFFVPIKPFRSHTFEIPLQRYFNLSATGKYEVTFTAGTNPGQPDNVEVNSNTISITVPSAEAQ
jgi:hypothetical protein